MVHLIVQSRAHLRVPKVSLGDLYKDVQESAFEVAPKVLL